MTTLLRPVGLSPVRHVMDNGAVILAKETKTTPAVTIHASLHAGGVFEPPELPGLAFFLSRVIDRGTETRTADEIALELDNRGVALAVNVTRHMLSLTCNCLVEDFEPMLRLIADIIRHPSLSEAEIATRRGEIITMIRQDEDNPATTATEGLVAMLYPNGHPYGRRPKGTVESAEAITRDRLAAFHRARVAPSTLSLVMVGDIEPQRAIAEAERAIGDWRAPDPAPAPLPRVAGATARRQRVIPMMNKAQADIAYGFITTVRSDPDYYAYALMNNALGQYALGGRLGDSIRERQGMAYYVFSAFEANVVEGPLMVRAGVNPANVERAIASIDAEIAAIVADGVTEKELAESKQYMIGSMPCTLETNAGIASFLQTIEFFNLGLDHDLRLPALLNAVTRDQVHAAARRSLSVERATIVVAGPYGSPTAAA